MEDASRNTLLVLGLALAYPAPGRLEDLERGLAAVPEGPTRRSFGAFLAGVRSLTLGQWEELCTHTLDLNPPAAPYIGYQVWGESYQRGAFLSKMSRALQDAGVDTGGELPDHLSLVLAYLACAKEPLPELLAALGPAVERTTKALRSSDPDNPYVKLYEAVQSACRASVKEDT